jgi:hypothetical protein
MFHSRLQYDFAALTKEEARYESLPDKQVGKKTIRETFLRIKREAKAVVADEMDRILNTPGLAGIAVRKNN